MTNKGYLEELLAETTIDDNTKVTGDAVAKLDYFTIATILLTVSAKTFDASTTLDIYVQWSPDEGTTWDDLVAFSQITNAAVGNGTYVVFLNPLQAAGIVDRITAEETLAAHTIQSCHWCDRMRVVAVGANISGSDTITVKVEGYFK